MKTDSREIKEAGDYFFEIRNIIRKITRDFLVLKQPASMINENGEELIILKSQILTEIEEQIEGLESIIDNHPKTVLFLSLCEGEKLYRQCERLKETFSFDNPAYWEFVKKKIVLGQPEQILRELKSNTQELKKLLPFLLHKDGEEEKNLAEANLSKFYKILKVCFILSNTTALLIRSLLTLEVA